MMISDWDPPPPNRKPSLTYAGELSLDVLYPAVGNAISRWEHMESGLIGLFQLMCETPKLNAYRAYSTIISSTGRCGAIRAAASVFFKTRDVADFQPIDKLLKAVATAAGYRNNIAHGIVVGMREGPDFLGYYVTSPSYGPKSTEVPYPDGDWWLGAKYFYRKSDVDHCAQRFEEILSITMQNVVNLNAKFGIMKTEDMHP